MIQHPLPEFLIIDDDPISNIISAKIIKLTIGGSLVQTFTDPQKGLEYIQSRYEMERDEKAILFLDINMPFMTGWEVLDRFNNFPGTVKEHITIFMLSSSVDKQDEQRAGSNSLVSGYITKSLSQQKIREVCSDLIEQ